jgi:hypothetical protein
MALYNAADNFNSLVMPPQMVSLSDKMKDDRLWGKKCMDTLEQVAYTQIQGNYKLVENYEMVKGQFIPTHYFGDEGYQSMLTQLSSELELPNYLRHYDIISPVLNTLSGEFQKRPDLFRIKAWDENNKNEYLTKKTELIKNFISSIIEKQVNDKLIEQGIDTNQQFQSQEEADKYEEFKNTIRTALTPPEIEEYMTTEFRTAAEIWAECVLDMDKERFSLDEKEKVEFEDMIISDRCFRHFYITGKGYEQETWNPVNVFYHKSDETIYIEDGDYVGRQFYGTPSDIIDRYGFRMKKSQIEMLEKFKENNDRRWNETPGSGYVYQNYMFPFKGYQGWDIVNKGMGATDPSSPYGIPKIPDNFFDSFGSNMYSEKLGMFLITEGYWMSQKKIGLYTYFDEELGIVTSTLVDENVILPDDIIVIDEIEEGSEEENINTIAWTYVNEVWQGVKINVRNADVTDEHNTDAIYLDLQPLSFQFKGDINPYNAKLPVCGQIFSVRNSKSASLVDLMKPYQIGFNVAMNQVYQMMEKEIGAFMVMDVNMFPDSKDWGGEDAWEKWMLIAKNLGMLPADTSPANTKGASAAAGGQFPKILNLDLAAQFTSRINLAQIFKKFALEQIGFNDYRLGNFNQSSTATGIEEGQQRSFAQTESYFTNFYNYLKRCKRMNLDIAQFVQAKDADITFNYVKSDLSTAYIKIAGTDLMGSDLHVFVTNSQEHLRQLEASRQLGLQNTTQMTEDNLLELITSNSLSSIKKKIKDGVKKRQEKEQQALDMQQQQTEAMKEVETMKQQKEDERLEKKLASAEYIAQIQLEAANGGDIPDSINMQNQLKNQEMTNRQSSESTKNQIANQQRIDNRQLKEKELALKNKKIDTDLEIQNKELESVKILKDKTDKK